MRIAIIGAGAMGNLFAYMLSKTGDADICLLDIHSERVEKIRQEGLFIEGISGDHHIKPRIELNAADIGLVDLALLCVKAPDTFKAASDAAPLLGPDTPMLTLQNGLGNMEAIEQALGTGRCLGGTTAMGATVLSLNRVRHAGWGETVIGEPSGKKTERAEKILSLFKACEMEISFTDNLQGLLWSKLIINVGINALTAITGLHNGQLPLHEGTRSIMEMAVAEATQVFEALNIKLLYENPAEKVASVCEATAGNIASMLQDVLKEKKTEIDQINGIVIREAEKLGIPTPVNQTLLSLVKTLEQSYDKRIREWKPAS